jgi:hypothetical protein
MHLSRLMSTSLAGLVALSLALAGCLSASQTAPDAPIGAAGLQPTRVDKDAGLVGVAPGFGALPGFTLQDFPVVMVERVEVVDHEVVDERTQRLAATLAASFQSHLVRRLRESGLFTRVVSLGDSDIVPVDAGRALRLRGTITRLARASRAARALTGVRAGSTLAQAEMQLVDAQSGQAVLVTADRRLGSIGLFDAANERFLEESFDDIALDLTRFLVRVSRGEVSTAAGGSDGSPHLSYDSAGWPRQPIRDAKSIAGTWLGTVALPATGVVPLALVVDEDGSYESLTPSGRFEGSYRIASGEARFKSAAGGRTGIFELRARDGQRRLIVSIDGGGGAELKPASTTEEKYLPLTQPTEPAPAASDRGHVRGELRPGGR